MTEERLAERYRPLLTFYPGRTSTSGATNSSEHCWSAPVPARPGPTSCAPWCRRCSHPVPLIAMVVIPGAAAAAAWFGLRRQAAAELLQIGQ